MKPYQQLQESYKQSEKDRQSWHDKAVETVSAALMALRDYLDAPEGKCRFAPIKRDRREGVLCGSPLAAVTHDQDGWWSGCLLIDISPDDLLSNAELSITISAFVDTDRIIFRVGDSKQRHTCQEVNAETLKPVIDEVISRSRQFLESGLDRFLDNVREDPQSSSHGIGFTRGPTVP